MGNSIREVMEKKWDEKDQLKKHKEDRKISHVAIWTAQCLCCDSFVEGVGMFYEDNPGYAYFYARCICGKTIQDANVSTYNGTIKELLK